MRDEREGLRIEDSWKWLKFFVASMKEMYL